MKLEFEILTAPPHTFSTTQEHRVFMSPEPSYITRLQTGSCPPKNISCQKPCLFLSLEKTPISSNLFSPIAFIQNHIQVWMICCCCCYFATLQTVTRQAPLSMTFSRQEYWSGLPCPPPRNLPNPGVTPGSHVSWIIVPPGMPVDDLTNT